MLILQYLKNIYIFQLIYVYVCILMINDLPINIDYKDLLSKISFNLTDRNCMLRNCSNCPDLESVKVFILNVLNENNYNDSGLIKFREWISTAQETQIVIVTVMYILLRKRLH